MTPPSNCTSSVCSKTTRELRRATSIGVDDLLLVKGALMFDDLAISGETGLVGLRLRVRWRRGGDDVEDWECLDQRSGAVYESNRRVVEPGR